MSLDDETAGHVRRLQEQSVIVLAHDHFLPPDDIEALRQGNVAAKILLAILDARAWSPDEQDYRRSIETQDGWFDDAVAIYERILGEIERRPELTLIQTAQDVLDAKRDGKIGILLGAEGGKLLEGRIENLAALYTLGLRHILLTWAFDNQLSASERDTSGRGLTAFGRQVVVEMNRLGMVIDITHVSRAAMREVLELSTRPVLNSHTSMKSLANRVPALTADEVRAVADQGGVVALHFMTHMLTGRFSPRAELTDVLAQIDALIDAGGLECVALGPDYLPLTEDFCRNTAQRELSFPVGLESPAGLPTLVQGLVQHGYDDDAIGKILGGNLLRLFRETIG